MILTTTLYLTGILITTITLRVITNEELNIVSKYIPIIDIPSAFFISLIWPITVPIYGCCILADIIATKIIKKLKK
jgi:hypothetical protein